MLEIINLAIQIIRPFLVPICLVTAWGMLGLVLWSLWSAARDSVDIAKQMHQIPCANCQFFTADYRLKCTVHPSRANTEEAIDCGDFHPKSNTHGY